MKKYKISEICKIEYFIRTVNGSKIDEVGVNLMNHNTIKISINKNNLCGYSYIKGKILHPVYSEDIVLNDVQSSIFLENLKTINVLNWNDTYKSNKTMYGEDVLWEINIYFSDGNSKKIKGYNAQPTNLNYFMNMIRYR